jgi:hypothetical protein|nr:MAG TPA: hypothetical protein [Crassvirales sp.]
MNKNYNRFIACWLANSIDLLFDSDDNLLYPVPFGEYQVGDYIDSDEFDNFQKSYKQYIVEHNMKIIQQGLSVVDDIMYIQDCIFTMDNKYYQVPLEIEDLKPLRQSWLYNDIEKYEVYPKTVTTTIYVSKNDEI